MKLPKYLLFIGLSTTLALFYVWGKVELVRVSYEIKKVEREARLLLDRNRSLMYNVASLNSPSRLAQEVASRNLVAVPPKNFALVHLIETKPVASQVSGRTQGRRSIFNFFTLRAQAEASQVK